MIPRPLRELLKAALVVGITLGSLALARAALREGGPRPPPIDVLLDLSGARSRGHWIAVALATLASFYAVRVIRALRPGDAPSAKWRAGSDALEARSLAALGAASTAAFVLDAGWLIHAARTWLPTSTSEQKSFAPLAFERLVLEMSIWTVVGGILPILAVLWGAAGVTWARRWMGGSRVAIAAIITMSALVSFTGLSLLRFVIDSSRSPCGIDQAGRYAGILDNGELLGQACQALIGGALIGGALILIAARLAPREVASRRSSVASLGLFALGLAAFALTRGFAHDARHPLPLWKPEATTWLSEATVAALPRAAPCTLGELRGPLVELAGDAWLVDGTAARTADLVAVLMAKKELWIQVSSSKSFPGIVQAAIPASTPMSRVRPLLEAAREAGYPDLHLLEGLPPRTFTTRTRGEIAYAPRLCFVSASGADAPPFTGTWGDWVSSLAPR